LLQADRPILVQADLTGRRRGLPLRRILLGGRRVLPLRRILLGGRRIARLLPVLRGRHLLGRRRRWRRRLLRRCGLGGGRVHIHAVIGDQRGETARVALPDRAHLPPALPAVHLQRDDDRLPVQAVDAVLVEPVSARVRDDRRRRG